MRDLLHSAPVKPKPEPMSEDEDDDKPWGERVKPKEDVESDDDDQPWSQKMNGDNASEDDEDDKPWGERVKKEEPEDSDDNVSWARKVKKDDKKRRKTKGDSDDDEEFVPEKKPKKEKASSSKKELSKSKKETKVKKEVKKEDGATVSPRKKKKQEEEEEVWKWWEEEKKPDGVKWNTLVHFGPMFAPEYEVLPKSVRFYYDKKPMVLSSGTEEVATFYARMLDHEYTEKDQFNANFFKDWRKEMTAAEREKIVDLKKCDFMEIAEHFKKLSEERKSMTKEQKQVIKEQKEAELKQYGFCFIDGHKQKIGNFRIEPPGLFRGRGGHPKMGKLKKRIQPEDVIINSSKGESVPKPPPGHKWKEVRHDNTVSWLCSWTENVLGSNKYMMLNPSSKMKGEKDYEKFETARALKSKVAHIREVYTSDWKSKEMRVRQRAVALYFIDKLALRAGNEKDVDEAADTVGCCSLRCEHIKLLEEHNGKQFVVEFDFLGKDSIRYYNAVPVDKRVFKNLKLFMENKDPGDDLFDRLDTSSLNAHLQTLMPGLTVKVFRTYNASITLQEQLKKLTKDGDSIHDKILSYNRANREVAILCNHQRAIPKTHEQSMEKLQAKIKDKKKEYKDAKEAYESARGAEKEKLKKKYEQKKEQLKKLKIQKTDKDENKQIALGTSKLNYLDPRITVAWCKKNEIPLEKIFTKQHREKFRWAIDMADQNYVF
ncbi:hypothetical protein L596_009749 [Steinernema carpocapsae]|uniref:DNA topoisomerase I n=1 Tax=Steinernema carpocapsae TaxID=34508 RepID=A0A4U5PGS7_STECR|nr:hypothetical protein L596_009749 [Steinernema carpocapsae]